MKSIFFVSLLPCALAFELPFSVFRLFSARSPVQVTSTKSTTPKIAIIGAGAGGSSAAFWISKGKERFGLDVQIDVYESSDYIGGRSTVVFPYNNKSLPELELGASIFVQPNRNLWRASDEFNLTRKDFEQENYETGIWDGKEIFLSLSGGWSDTAKLLWRYGILSPKRTEDIVRKLVQDLLRVYQPTSPKWDTIAGLVKTLGWTGTANSTTVESFKGKGVSDQYIFEVVQAATRVNYGQNTDEIHAVGGAVSMAASMARGIVGGNFKIFEQFLDRSGANVYLNTKVNSVTSTPSGWTLASSRGTAEYTAVVLAAPFHSARISVPTTISEQIPAQPYVHLHVTLLSSTAPHPNPQYFGYSEGTKVPRVVLTTKERSGSFEKPEFNSLSYHGLVREGEWAVKIFSDHRISDEWLDNMFQGQVKWVLRKEWDAYPKLIPATSFPPMRLDRGFYYVNSFEPLISTMETETISSRNVVDLLLHDEFNAGICKPDDNIQKATTSKSSEDFVLGFDYRSPPGLNKLTIFIETAVQLPTSLPSMLPPVFVHLFKHPLPYTSTWNLQETIHKHQLELRKSGEHPDVLLLLQHRPVYTTGRRQNEPSIQDERVRLQTMGADFVPTTRGGQLTYHGPGQIVGYPMLDLSRYAPTMATRDYVCRIQKILKDHIQESHGISAVRSENTGVFLDATTKLASIGVQVRHRLTSHGFAVNITNEPLAWFDQIVACGLNDVRAGSIESKLNKPMSLEDEMEGIIRQFGKSFARDVAIFEQNGSGIGKAINVLEREAEDAGDWATAPSTILMA